MNKGYDYERRDKRGVGGGAETTHGSIEAEKLTRTLLYFEMYTIAFIYHFAIRFTLNFMTVKTPYLVCKITYTF